MAKEVERDSKGRFRPGTCGNPDAKWGPDNPPPRSPGRPKRDAWLAELEDRLGDQRIRQALADRLLRVALQGNDRAALAALKQIQDRVAGVQVRRFEVESEMRGGVLVAPGSVSPAEWVSMEMARGDTAVDDAGEDDGEVAEEP